MAEIHIIIHETTIKQDLKLSLNPIMRQKKSDQYHTCVKVNRSLVKYEGIINLFYFWK